MNYYASHFINEKTGPERLNDMSKATQLINYSVIFHFLHFLLLLLSKGVERFVSLKGEPVANRQPSTTMGRRGIFINQ